MHKTAMEIGAHFFRTYSSGTKLITIADIGSQDVNGSLRSLAPVESKYVGLDFANGKGVDVLINDPYSLPIESDSVDVVVSSSCFEHSEFFWLLFNDIQRILKPHGLFYLNAPSNGTFHRYPADCWRFYPDSGTALQNWARRSGYETTLLESFTGMQKMETWNDFIAVFIKDPSFINLYPRRIIDSYRDFTNGLKYGSDELINPARRPEDQRKPFGKVLKNKVKKLIPKRVRKSLGN